MIYYLAVFAGITIAHILGDKPASKLRITIVAAVLGVVAGIVTWFVARSLTPALFNATAPFMYTVFVVLGSGKSYGGPRGRSGGGGSPGGGGFSGGGGSFGGGGASGTW